MTTEKIEKAVEEYAESLKSIAFENLSGEETPYLLRGAFKEGLESANKYWQERTRWTPIEEKLPVFEGKRRTILVKTGDDLYSFLWIIQEVSLSDFECQGYTHWKEIEL